MKYFSRVFPFLAWRAFTTPRTLRDDFLAGLTVAFVLIPQSMAYALLAGVPLQHGLYAAFVPAAVGALFGSSRQLATGPVAMTSLLTAASIQRLGYLGDAHLVTSAILLALLSGLIQVALGLLRAGFIVNFVSHPALNGFTSAAALIIAGSQLGAVLGLPMGRSGFYLGDFAAMLQHVPGMHLLTLCTGIAAFTGLILIRKYAPRAPAALFVVAGATLLSYFLRFERLGVDVVGEIPRGLPEFSLPAIGLQPTIALLPAAATIALISFMEAVASAKIMATKTRVPWDKNQELIGQGLAKVAAALSQGFPVSGSFSRSALNLANGAKTGMSSVFTACVLLVALLVATPLLYHLPTAVLAALIISAVGNLVDFRAMAAAWKAERSDGIVAWVTFSTTLLFAPNIQDGIVAGIVLSLFFFIYQTTRPRIVVLGRREDGTLGDSKRRAKGALPPALAAIRFDDRLYFANVSYFEAAVRRLLREKPAALYVLVVCSGINSIDASGVHTLETLAERLRDDGITMVFSMVKIQVWDVLERTGALARLGRENFFRNNDQALAKVMYRLKTSPEPPAEPEELQAVAEELGDEDEQAPTEMSDAKPQSRQGVGS
jgi:SulP family sulfate permease